MTREFLAVGHLGFRLAELGDAADHADGAQVVADLAIARDAGERGVLEGGLELRHLLEVELLGRFDLLDARAAVFGGRAFSHLRTDAGRVEGRRLEARQPVDDVVADLLLLGKRADREFHVEHNPLHQVFALGEHGEHRQVGHPAAVPAHRVLQILIERLQWRAQMRLAPFLDLGVAGVERLEHEAGLPLAAHERRIRRHARLDQRDRQERPARLRGYDVEFFVRVVAVVGVGIGHPGGLGLGRPGHRAAQAHAAVQARGNGFPERDAVHRAFSLLGAHLLDEIVEGVVGAGVGREHVHAIAPQEHRHRRL